MGNLFEAAARDPQLIMQIVQAMEEVAARAGVTRSDDPVRFVQALVGNESCVRTLGEQLHQIAVTNGLQFTPETSALPARYLEAIEALWDACKEKTPVTTTISTPIAFLFIAAALLFAPGEFRAAGGTLYGGEDAVSGVDGIVPFV